MLTLLAHAGHFHGMKSMDTMNAIDHCMAIILSAGIIIIFLLGVIVYLLSMWQPKTNAKPKASRKKK